ncbi:acyl carrier protein [Oceaniferula marina]|uniref:acyl carrier protein n=1 Tax=Oceaniferula marina TaxID=2748318 RepID=UPI0031BA4703
MKERDTPKESVSYDSKTSQKITKIISELLSLKQDQIKPDHAIIGDLGADSLDAVELIMWIEEDFNISIADADAEKLVTVGDLIRYVERKTKKSKSA